MVATTGSTARGIRWQRRARTLVVAAALAAVALTVTAMAADSGASVADARQVAIVGGTSGRWLVGGDGVVTNIGTAEAHRTSVGAAVAGVATPSGSGYFVTDARGIVSATGGATWSGDLRQFQLNNGIVGMASSRTGRGYWLVASDGGIFAFGDTGFHGSTGNITLNQPIVGMAATPTGNGYWLVARDGGIFAFGDAAFHGSLGGHWVDDVVGIMATPSGYAVADSNGRVAEFGASRQGVLGDEWTVPAHGRAAAIAAQVHSKMNDERVARGLEPLMWDTELAATASAWSLEMSSSGFRHSDVTGTMGRVGGLDRLAENIFRGSLSYADAGSAHIGFMQSPEHRHTLLASAYTTAGVGVRCDAAGQLWVTVHFAAPTGHAPAGTRPPTTPHPVAAPDQGGAGC